MVAAFCQHHCGSVTVPRASALVPGPGPTRTAGTFRLMPVLLSSPDQPARPRNPRCPGIGAGLPRSRPSRDSRFPESRDPGQIGMPDVPGSRPNRESGLESRKFPGSRPNRDSNPGKSRFFCSGQNRDCTLSAAGQAIAFPRRGPWVGKETHRPMTRSRQRLHAPVEA